MLRIAAPVLHILHHVMTRIQRNRSYEFQCGHARAYYFLVLRELAAHCIEETGIGNQLDILHFPTSVVL